MTLIAKVNVEALVMAAIILSITLGITYWASKRASSAVGFYAAGRNITARQNGLAISGDYLSAASFLGIAGLIYLYGFDGFLYSIGFLVAFLTVMFLLAERMRNAGKYTIADVLVVPPDRDARACRRGARHVRRRDLLPDRADGRRGRADLEAGRHRLLDRRDPDRHLHALLRDLRRHGRHDVGADRQGRAADDRHPRDVGLRARQGRASTRSSSSTRPRRTRPRSRRSRSARAPILPKPLDTVSLGLALVLGTAGLPHILMRFFTVPTAKAARTSVVWAIVHHRLLLPADHVHRLRRARLPGRGRRRGARAPAATWRRRTWRRSSAAARARSAATSSWRRSPASRSRRSWPWSRASCSPPRPRSRTTSGPRSCARARTPSTRRSSSRGSPRSRSA